MDFRCSTCGRASPQWFGRCPECGAWSSAEQPTDGVKLVPLALAGRELPRKPTGLAEVDRVLGGGVIDGAVVLVAGEPGIGKSTLLLQLVDSLAARGARTLFATAEESVDQVALRAHRLGLSDRLRAAASSSVAAIIEGAIDDRPHVLVVDSIQALVDRTLDQGAGSVVQVRECAAALTAFAKQTGTIVLIAGHVTKDGSVAGPKTLEHVVDVVLSLEGERTGNLRLLRALKNRFGSCDETGVLVMTERGLDGVGDPSAMLLGDRQPGVAGAVVMPALEGSRPLLVELQALVASSNLVQARRVAIGVDSRRLALLLGILSSRADIKLSGHDVFVAAVGGLTVSEPAADLGICVALCSALARRPVDADTAVMGELGLAGEVRRVPGMQRRLAEAARLGFSRAIVPQGTGAVQSSLDVVTVSQITDALDALNVEVPQR